MQPLQASADGVRLNGGYAAPLGRVFNVNPNGRDELYCQARWMDADAGFVGRADDGGLTGFF